MTSLEVDLRQATATDLAEALRAQLADAVTALVIRSKVGRMPSSVLAERHRPALVSLSLIEDVGDIEPACGYEPDLLWERAPNLERLRLRAERSLFHAIAHARLREMVLEVAPLCEQGRWELPSLETLEIDPHIESDCDIDALDAIWPRRQQLPALRELVLRGPMITFEPTLERDDVRHFVSGLRRLSLRSDALLPVDGGIELAAHLIEQGKHLEHLEHLVVEVVDPDTAGDLASAVRRLPRLEVTGLP